MIHAVRLNMCSRPEAFQSVNIDLPLQMASYAIVTGGNRGLGLELCRKLVLLNKPVILTARSAQAGKSDSSALGHPENWRFLAALVHANVGNTQISCLSSGLGHVTRRRIGLFEACM